MVKNTGATPSKRSRQVTIPAGKLYIVFNPGETVYLTEGKNMPATLHEYVRQKQEQAFEEGKQFRENELNRLARNTRQQTPEEFLQSILPTIHNYHAKDQNQIAAVILDELTKARERRLGELQQQLDNVKELIGLCEDSQKGLQLVREGGFEKLNFR
jgi:hypothetical protein